MTNYEMKKWREENKDGFWDDEKRRWIFLVGTMKKLSLWLCIWFWWRRVIVRVLKITKMTLKMVLKEGKSSILHRVVKSARFDPHHARFCPQLRPLHPPFSKHSALELRRTLLFLAAIDNRGLLNCVYWY